MRIEKNKIVFSSILLTITLFIIAYAMMVLDKGEEDKELLERTDIPKLEEQGNEYRSRLEAVDKIEDVRTSIAPDIYGDGVLDSPYENNTDLTQEEKQRIVDSIYKQGRIKYRIESPKNSYVPKEQPKNPIAKTSIEANTKVSRSSKELALEHQLFFASVPQSILEDPIEDIGNIHVEVDGDQVVRANGRLRMRLLHPIRLDSINIPKNTLIYGIVSFRPNRTVLNISNIDHIPIELKAFDLQDGLEGIYVENSFRGEVSKELAGDLANEINITGIPQIRGISKVLQRRNRNIKVKVANNYRLLLKTDLRTSKTQNK